MKKYLIILLTAVCIFQTVGCSSDDSAAGQLYVYNWGDYIDPEVIGIFTEETGIKVIYETFDTNESMYAKIKPGNSAYDVAFPSDYMIEKMVNEDMLEKINLDNIPNYKYIDEAQKSLYYDPDNEFSVTYMCGTVGILYNKDMVSEEVDSWEILWNDKYAGQIYMYDSQRDSFAVALKKLGYSLNTRDMDELNLAKDELIRQKPLVQAYLGDMVKDKMIGNEGALAVVYSGDAMYCIEENQSLDYALPKEGSNLWYDGVVIPKGAKNKENAEKFINFLCEPEIAAKNAMYIGYTTANIGADEYLLEERTNSPVYRPSASQLANCEPFYDLGSFISEVDRAWTEVLAAN